MKVYEFGEQEKPVIMLLSATCCYWKSNVGEVIDPLQRCFRVACVSYDGFDETEKIECYIKEITMGMFMQFTDVHWEGL